MNAIDYVLVISVVTSLIIFIVLTVIIYKKKPELIKNSLVQKEQTDDATTINWGMIRSITIQTVTFGLGIYTVGAAIVFVRYKELHLDGAALSLMAIVFLYFVCKELDKFITRHIKK